MYHMLMYNNICISTMVLDSLIIGTSNNINIEHPEKRDQHTTLKTMYCNTFKCRRDRRGV